jgi:hypothetical protein
MIPAQAVADEFSRAHANEHSPALSSAHESIIALTTRQVFPFQFAAIAPFAGGFSLSPTDRSPRETN